MFQYTSLRQTVAPTAEPLTLAEAKLFARIDDAIEDDIITELIRWARETVENFTGRQLITATWELQADHFPYTDTIVELPRPPLISATDPGDIAPYTVRIQYVDTAGVTQTFASTRYTVDTSAEPGRLYPVYGDAWPDTRLQPQAVTITYHSGYGGSIAAVPVTRVGWNTLRLAMKMLIDHRYNKRSAFGIMGSGAAVPFDVEDLLAHLVVGRMS